MRSETVWKRVRSYQGAITGYFNSVVSHRYTHARYLEHIHDVCGGPNYEELPIWAKHEIIGFREGMYEFFTRHMLEGQWELDGARYVKGKARDDAFAGRWHEAKYVGEFHKGTDKVWYYSDSYAPTTD